MAMVSLQERRPAQLVLEDGTVYSGWGFGASKNAPGEVGKLPRVCEMIVLVSISDRYGWVRGITDRPVIQGTDTGINLSIDW